MAFIPWHCVHVWLTMLCYVAVLASITLLYVEGTFGHGKLFWTQNSLQEHLFDRIRGRGRGTCSTNSTPFVDCVYQHKSKRKLKNLAGTSRAVQVDRDLHRSLCSNEVRWGPNSRQDNATKRQKRNVECSRKCPTILNTFAKIFRSIGRHCWLSRMYRQNAYLWPASIGSAEHYRNNVSELLVLAWCVHV